MDQGADLIGKPFAYGARGPDAFDCYGLVMEMSRRNDAPIPEFGLVDSAELAAATIGAVLPQWEVTPRAPGAVVLLRVGRLIAHVGYLLDNERMIHCWQQAHGVSVVRIGDWERRVIGFYRHAGQA